MNSVLVVFFLVSFAILAVLQLWVHLSLPPERKRLWHRRGVLAGAILLGTPLVLGTGVGAWDTIPPYLMAAVVLVITYVNFEKVRICTRCGKTNQPQQFFDSAEFCRRCGAPLTDEKSPVR